eukprot:1558611-Amphidinium_carterae.1
MILETAASIKDDRHGKHGSRRTLLALRGLEKSVEQDAAVDLFRTAPPNHIGNRIAYETRSAAKGAQKWPLHMSATCRSSQCEKGPAHIVHDETPQILRVVGRG